MDCDRVKRTILGCGWISCRLGIPSRPAPAPPAPPRRGSPSRPLAPPAVLRAHVALRPSQSRIAFSFAELADSGTPRAMLACPNCLATECLQRRGPGQTNGPSHERVGTQAGRASRTVRPRRRPPRIGCSVRAQGPAGRQSFTASSERASKEEKPKSFLHRAVEKCGRMKVR